MEQTTSRAGTASDVPPPSSRPPAPGRKRSSSGASGLLSKLTFMRSTGEHRPRSRRNTNESDPAGPSPALPIPSFITIPADATERTVPAAELATPPRPVPQPQQQQPPHVPQQSALQTALKTRRRRGSLRKVALLGRGAQRERREGKGLTIDTTLDDGSGRIPYEVVTSGAEHITPRPELLDGRNKATAIRKNNGTDLRYGLGIAEATPHPGMDGYTIRSSTSNPDTNATPITAQLLPNNVGRTHSNVYRPAADRSPSISYSTTDDEDALHMARSNSPSLTVPRSSNPSLSLSSSSAASIPHQTRNGSGGTLLSGGALPSIQRRRSATVQRAKSPLGLTSLAAAAAPLQQTDADYWDYAETEWWGWIILLVTWAVFVVGMGSCLGVWSWAWDVGTTPYAPPELEDDPTLPIVGYYPALMILTGVMAWVWVVVAWVGMKYFRHAQVSGD
ncbi:hypothetical protein VTI28DRAFT_3758 [Corynascus sepedonium]